VIEDNIYILESWKKCLDSATLLPFRSPSEFWAKMEQDFSVLFGLDCIITDFHFGNDTEDGVSLSYRVKEQCDVPIILSTNDVSADLDELGLFLAIIDKNPLSINAIKNLL